MDLLIALRDVREGKRITRRLLESEPGTFVEIQAGQLMIHRHDDKLYHPWIISETDLLVSDWFVLNPDWAPFVEVGDEPQQRSIQRLETAEE